ncbi:MAG: DUF5706 domain-containing protein [Gemmatimonadetes bacterium]|nr:DUF5706 domain-containing protein [Gemmatimonadota bacterium]
MTTPLSSLAPAVTTPEVLAQIDAAITGAVSADDKKGKKDKVEKSRKADLFKIVHDYQRRSIEFADRKATFIVFGANAFASFLEKTRGLSAMRSAPWASWTIAGTCGELAIVFLAAGGFTSLWVIVPRVGRNVPKGAIYWEAIRQYPNVKEWTAAMESITDEETNRTMLEGIYDLAGINVVKYRALQTATWLAGIGMGFALLNIAL